MTGADRRPFLTRSEQGLLVPPEMAGLDPEQRRLANQAVRSGTIVADPRLASAVAVRARHVQTSSALLLVCWGVAVGLAVASFRSAPALIRVVDVLLVAGVVVGTAMTLAAMSRARRAAALNRGQPDQR
jgi:hypothetical protein